MSIECLPIGNTATLAKIAQAFEIASIAHDRERRHTALGGEVTLELIDRLFKEGRRDGHDAINLRRRREPSDAVHQDIAELRQVNRAHTGMEAVGIEAAKTQDTERS